MEQTLLLPIASIASAVFPCQFFLQVFFLMPKSKVTVLAQYFTLTSTQRTAGPHSVVINLLCIGYLKENKSLQFIIS